MSISKIITEKNTTRLKNSFIEEIAHLDAEIIIIDAQMDHNRHNPQSDIMLGNCMAMKAEKVAARETLHNCLVELQVCITEIEI